MSLFPLKPCPPGRIDDLGPQKALTVTMFLMISIIDVENRHVSRSATRQNDRVASRNQPFSQYPAIEPRSPGRDKFGQHRFTLKLRVEFEARYTRPDSLQHEAPDLKTVPHPDCAGIDTIGGEIVPKKTVADRSQAQM
jgi:hypothetical protein